MTRLATAPLEASPTTDIEAHATLLDRINRKPGNIPPDVLVRHVLAIVPAEEWPVRVDALDAVLRRWEAVKRDGLKIATRPQGGTVLGPYTTRRTGATVRPYQSLLLSVEPIRASCGCPDFVRNSLGLCKHIMAVLDHAYSRPKLFKQAAASGNGAPSGLSWNPVRPLTGPGDWLERVTFAGSPNGKPNLAATQQLLRGRWFTGTKEGGFSLKSAFADDPGQRLELVSDLIKLLPVSSRSFGPDPALTRLLTGERHRLKDILEQTIPAAERRTVWKGLKRPLYPYQREGVARFLATGRLLLADDMGLGKTAQAIACTDILFRTGRARRALIITPASLKPQWAREWALFSDVPVHMVEGSPQERQALYARSKTGLFIINYEQLLRDLDTIRDWRPDLIVLDEAQRIKNWATKTALTVKGLTPPYRLVLTGTPMENRIDELASVVEWVDDLALEPKWRLNALHSIRADGKKEVIGVRHLDTLRERLRPCMLRRIRQEVLDQLPSRTDNRVPIEMTEAQIAEHQALVPSIVALMNRAKRRPLTQAEFLRLMSLLTTQRIISNGLAQLRFEEVWPGIQNCPPEESMIQALSAPKLLELRQLIRQVVLEQGRKAVVFSQWRRMLALANWAIGDILAEEDLTTGFFTGGEGQRRRTQNIVEFHDSPRHRVLFASDAGGVGLNLQRAANCVINLELPWNPAVLEQRIGRIYRLGQTQPIDVFNLVCEQGIESRIFALVGSKQAFFKSLFDGESDAVQFEQSSSFLSRVQMLVEPSALEAAAAKPETDEQAEALEMEEEELAATSDSSIDGLLDEADEKVSPVANRSAPPPSTTPFVEPKESSKNMSPRAAEVGQMLRSVQIRRETDGRLVLEAPPEAAETLSALFQGLAGLLQSAGR